MRSSEWLLYGASGYTGALIARAAVAAGMRPTLAGRSAERVAPLADELRLPWVSFALTDGRAVSEKLTGHRAVLHCAGPFTQTSAAMVDAALRAKVHYLDITGEIPVFQAIAARDAEAKAAGVMLLPGVGCDVVPSNCLAASLAERLPGARRLELACAFRTRPSRGTLRTIVEQFPAGGRVVRGGEVVSIRHGSLSRRAPFAAGEREVVAAPWGDLVAAYQATRIPDVAVYMALPALMRWNMTLFGGAAGVGGWRWVQRLLGRWIDGAREGPSEQERGQGSLSWWGQVADDAGRSCSGQVDIPDPYAFTVTAALAAVKRVLEGPERFGALAPAQALGPSFVTCLPGCKIRFS